jgi:hypothetical protein
MKYIFVSVILCLLINLVYALGNNEPMGKNHAKYLFLPHVVNYFYSTVQNANFWKMHRALKLLNTQVWGLNSGEDY